MAPETYFVSISPLFFDPFKATNGVQSNQTYVQILGKFAHRSPSNFEILTSVTSGYLGSNTSVDSVDKHSIKCIACFDLRIDSVDKQDILLNTQ